ncbi:tRNA (5-methylaminomethyl-2-thiouridine)(34)-methyltransferase MnmC2 [Spirosoma koreense]
MKADVRLIVTADGSHTAINQVLDKTYHSVHGAYQESQRVYIELGLLAAFEKFSGQPLQVFEMGFGTGLNALLTAQEAEVAQRQVVYTAVEAFPMSVADAAPLNYDELLGTHYLQLLHQSEWNELARINPYFTLFKHESRLQDFQPAERFDLIYYDAFAPTAQPELWSADIFQQLASFLRPGGILTTYCSKSEVQRNMRAAGLTVEKHPGPPHKRDILRAIK